MKFLFLFLLPVTSAGDVPAPTLEKIGYVDLQSTLLLTEQGQREQARLKKESEAKQHKLNQMQDEVKKLKDDLDKQGAMLKEEARARKQSELEAKITELQQLYVSLQKELADKGGAVTKEIFTRAKGIVEKIGDRDGYTVILDRTEANVLYFKRHMDLTDEVVRAYNAQYK